MVSHHVLFLAVVLAALAATVAAAQERPAEVRVDLTNRLGVVDMRRIGLGQGGLSPEPMWEDRIPEVRALHPGLIRLFLQEYFDLMPRAGQYNFKSLDRSVDTILRAGSKPLMCLCFKPRALFPKIDQDVVEPTSYAEWDELVYRLVKHYRDRGAGIRYWEVANEPDIGEDGGCPYRFQPESYVRYYAHTAAAVLRADPEARVGGPALANVRSPILPALFSACEREKLPLHFVSWHIYSSSPTAIRGTIDYVHELLQSHPILHPETVLDEWNMDLGTPPPDARYQPCYLLETAWQMLDAGLQHSCYYHIRDWHVRPEQFAPFMSERGTAFMARWWNRMPQFDGLFDYENTVRPAYYAFKLLARLSGARVEISSSDARVHGFAAYDQHYRLYNVLIWNFSPSPRTVTLELSGVPEHALMRHFTLDALAASADENARLRPDAPQRLAGSRHTITVMLEPFGIQAWSVE